ncbi:MAG: acyltransferase family protein [Chloroflexota bacterium]|nr:acyltransferase family protein [Chloroflexota bacterium]
MSTAAPDSTRRYHGLDGLRGFAVLLGIVVHASLPYFSRLLRFEFAWPADDDQSLLLFLVFDFIHAWRMPVFFLMAGFFAHLVLSRRAMTIFAMDRLKRIGLPLVLFGAVMAVLIPPIWIYGWTGEMSIETFWEVVRGSQDLGSSGELVAHLWFLYQLLLMYAALLAFRLLASTGPARRALQSTDLKKWCGRAGIAVYARFPLLLALAGIALLVFRGGDESKPIWPLNWPDFLYGALFFFYGYGLFARRQLIDRWKEPAVLVALWLTALAAFLAHFVLLGALDDASNRGAGQEEIESIWLLATIFYGTAAALICAGLIGLFERVLQRPLDWVRWLSDSAYWVYILHLPLVAFLTFWFAHLDRRGRLDFGLGLEFGAEAKFLVACVVTGAIAMVSYRYLVRYTLLGSMLNGPRTRVRSGAR